MGLLKVVTQAIHGFLKEEISQVEQPNSLFVVWLAAMYPTAGNMFIQGECLLKWVP